MLKKLFSYLVVAGIACVGALNYEFLVFPNQFAPAGLNGICTMIQYLGGISVGSLSLLINIPLAILIYFKVSKPLALRSAIYFIVFSVMLLILDQIDLSDYIYKTETGTSIIMGPLVAGVINGACYAILVKASAYSGGMDFVASLVHKYRPETNVFWTIFALNITVALASYFVYGLKIEPVLMSILYSFATSTVSDRLSKAGNSAVRFEIITQDPEHISRAIVEQLHHSATLIPAKGIYQGKETNILICIINKSQVTVLAALLRNYPHTFAVATPVINVVGNFKHLDVKGKPEVDLLDHGDSTEVP